MLYIIFFFIHLMESSKNIFKNKRNARTLSEVFRAGGIKLIFENKHNVKQILCRLMASLQK